jgi:RNA-directed DNA polymerase
VAAHQNINYSQCKQAEKSSRGWLNYFRLASIQGKLKELDSWLRNRIRYCIWHNWKKPERKRKNLISLGIPVGQAYAWSRTRMGGWAVAQSPILITTVTLESLRKRGYQSMLDTTKEFPHYLTNRCIRDPYVQCGEAHLA